MIVIVGALLTCALARVDPKHPAGFVELPCEFVENLPYVVLSWYEERRPRRSKFLLDTGASASVFFPSKNLMKVRQIRLSGGEKRTDLGTLWFVPFPKDYLGESFVGYLRKNGAEGILGSDFARKHDILVDYRSHRLYVSKERKQKDSVPEFAQCEGLKAISLIEFGGRWTVPVVWNKEPRRIAFMIVDTGAAQSSLPASAYPTNRPSTADWAGILNVRGLFEGWKEKRALLIGQFDTPLCRTVSFIDGEIDPVIATSDLGDRVFFCLRRNEVWSQLK